MDSRRGPILQEEKKKSFLYEEHLLCSDFGDLTFNEVFFNSLVPEEYA